MKSLEYFNFPKHLTKSHNNCHRDFIMKIPPKTTALLILLLALTQGAPTTAQCNTPPTAVNDSAEAFDDRTLWIFPLANDTDPEGEALALTLLSEDCPGTVTSEAGGLLFYEPAFLPHGTEQTCSIHYRIADTAGDTATATIDVTVISVPPWIFLDGFESGDLSAWSLEE